MDQQGSQAEIVKHKNMVLLEESKQLQHKAEALERSVPPSFCPIIGFYLFSCQIVTHSLKMHLVANRKLEEATSQNRDLLQVIAKREETIHSNQVRLEEKSRECSILTRQLEEALEDARRQVRLEVIKWIVHQKNSLHKRRAFLYFSG